jgi:2-C-methyl-D-erythritol 4-phosphate cytidylyltransferase
LSRSRQPGPKPIAGYGIIVAAGRGTRFGAMKQFAIVKGRPLLWYSLRAFERCPDITACVVVTTRERIPHVRRLAARHRFRKLTDVVAGGRHRCDSVRAGLAALPARGTVAVHDGARPLIDPDLLSAGLRLAARRAVTCGYPVADTVKRVARGTIVATIDRSGLYAVQTPQFFPLSLLRRAHKHAGSSGTRATDDCALVELLGIRPRIMLGPQTNVKVTTREDLDLVRKLL